jgi:hypothetical protein
MYKYTMNIGTSEKRIVSQNLNNFNLNYKLETPEEIDYTDSETNEIMKYIKMEEHYSAMRNKLINQTKHPIDINRITQWTNEQPNELFKNAAVKFANNIIYTDYETIISTVEKIGEILKDDFANSVVLLGNKDKSGYYFSLLIIAYLYEKYDILPLSFSRNFISGFQKYGTNVVYFDIDDMMYTGSQTIDLLFRYINSLKWSFQVEEKNNIDKTVNLLLKHEYLKKIGLNYKLIRLNMTTYSMSKCFDYKKIILPFEIITNNELIPTFKESILDKNRSKESVFNYVIIQIFFNLNYSSMTCSYFDYKIADLASTTAFPLLTGYIPSTSFINYYLENEEDLIYDVITETGYNKDNIIELIKEFKDLCKTNNLHKLKFINFIKNCSPKKTLIENFDEMEFHKTYGVFQEDKNLDNSIINDCPKPFYKHYRLFGSKIKRRTSKNKRRSISIKKRKSKKSRK